MKTTFELPAEPAGYEIIPKHDLAELDAFLGINLKSVFINGSRYDTPAYNRRVRFSIAHELGHAVLHSDFILSQKINTIESYMDFTGSLNDEEYSDFEWQANEFAGDYWYRERN